MIYTLPTKTTSFLLCLNFRKICNPKTKENLEISFAEIFLLLGTKITTSMWSIIYWSWMCITNQNPKINQNQATGYRSYINSSTNITRQKADHFSCHTAELAVEEEYKFGWGFLFLNTNDDMRMYLAIFIIAQFLPRGIFGWCSRLDFLISITEVFR